MPVVPLFRIAGVAVSLRVSVIVASLALAVLSPFALVCTAALLLSTLLHELAHAVVAVRHGVRVAGIELGVFGGATRIESALHDPRAELAIAAAGPLASAVAAIVAGLVALFAHSGAALFVAALNASVFVVNALPLLPFDGGRMLRAHLARTRDFADATRKTARVNTVVAVVVALAGAGLAVAGGPLPCAVSAVACAVALHTLGAIEARRAAARAALAASSSWALAARL